MDGGREGGSEEGEGGWTEGVKNKGGVGKRGITDR